MTMFVVIVALFVLLAVAGLLRWTADSRDGADWAPTQNGQRVRRR